LLQSVSHPLPSTVVLLSLLFSACSGTVGSLLLCCAVVLVCLLSTVSGVFFFPLAGLPPSCLPHHVGGSWGQRSHSVPPYSVHFCSGSFFVLSAST
jgi:hypothetical protein